MKINGIAHIQLSVQRFEECKAFYEKLLPFFEMTLMYKSADYLYYVGGKTGIAISRAGKECPEAFNELRSGLHHFCFRLKSNDDVDELSKFVTSIGGTVTRPPQYHEEWAPGYYSILFEDPEGLQIEANHVPGKGNLDENVSLPKNWSGYDS